MSHKEEFIDLIKSNETIKRYRQIEEVINKNSDLKSKINEVKTVQKQLVNAKEIKKAEAIKAFEIKMENLLDEISDFPLLNEYLDLQDEINSMLKNVLSIIEDEINNSLI